MLVDWGPLSQLPIEIQDQLENKLKSITLSPGEELNQIDHLPPGVLYIQEGQMRLLAFDQTNNLYPEVYVSVSCEVNPVFREYERMITTILNSYSGKGFANYMGV